LGRLFVVVAQVDEELLKGRSYGLVKIGSAGSIDVLPYLGGSRSGHEYRHDVQCVSDFREQREPIASPAFSDQVAFEFWYARPITPGNGLLSSAMWAR
jgi:hypothetical protein